MKFITQLFSPLRSLLRGQKAKNAVILGAGYEEFRLFRRLTKQGQYQVLFFIDEEPWNHRTKIEGVELRYPTELASLCKNYEIEAVFYLEESYLDKPSAIDVPFIKLDN